MPGIPATFLAALALTLTLTQSIDAQQLPPVRPLGTVEHSATELLGAVSSTRALPGGRVLVNDIIGRRVLLFDPSLSSYTVVADTTSATANAYSSRFGGLIAYRGDSTLFVDPTSLSMLVIDGAGKIARVMSVPRPNDARSLIGGPNGSPGFDAQGRLVYRAGQEFRRARGAGSNGARGGADRRAPAGQSNGGRIFQPPELPDSIALVRIDLATRAVDTLAKLKVARNKLTVSTDSTGRMHVTSIIHPLQSVDDWAVLADGSIAIVRGIDYHIDWIRPDGSTASTPKLGFPWRHLSDSDKVAFIDSTRQAMERVRRLALDQRSANGNSGSVMPQPPDGDITGGVGAIRMERGGFRARRGGGENPPARNDGGAAPTAFTLPPLEFVQPSELADYAPPFTPGAVRADMDGNVWVRTTNVVNGGPVYDVINGKGDLVDRVLLPAGRVIAGFGPGGRVFMGVREAAGVRLEEARRGAETAKQ